MIKELIPVRFGDGTMSAVDFRSDVRRVPDRAGERSVAVFDGEFPLFAWSGPFSEGGPALAERCGTRRAPPGGGPSRAVMSGVLYAPGVAPSGRRPVQVAGLDSRPGREKERTRERSTHTVRHRGQWLAGRVLRPAGEGAARTAGGGRRGDALGRTSRPGGGGVGGARLPDGR
ncbi:hypothetical protein GTY85_15580 [Streptomyces sp. SID8377]|nr:hypothetical protein [Streptomyces sp. SID8377]